MKSRKMFLVFIIVCLAFLTCFGVNKFYNSITKNYYVEMFSIGAFDNPQRDVDSTVKEYEKLFIENGIEYKLPANLLKPMMVE